MEDEPRLRHVPEGDRVMIARHLHGRTLLCGITQRRPGLGAFTSVVAVIRP